MVVSIALGVAVLSAMPAFTAYAADTDQAAIKQHLLENINGYRANMGWGNLTLGNNTAAQEHAEDMLEHCYTSIWGRDGFSIDARYALAGDSHFGGAVVTGNYEVSSLPCRPAYYLSGIALADRMWEDILADRDLRLILQNYNAGQAHLGVALDGRMMALVIILEDMLMDWIHEPHIVNGVLHMSGNYTNEAVFGDPASSLEFTLFYDRTPQNLTAAQLTHADCGDTAIGAAVLVRAADFGEYVYTIDEPECTHPYDMGPKSRVTPMELWSMENPGCLFPFGGGEPTCITPLPEFTPYVPCPFTGCPPPEGNTPEVLMQYRVASGVFIASADISDILDEYGPGIYGLVVFGRANTGPHVIADTVIGHHTIFHDVDVDRYGHID